MTASQAVFLLAKIAAVAAPVGAAAAFFYLRRAKRPRAAVILTALIAVGWALGLWAFLIEPETLTIRRVAVDSADWSGPPLKIGVISDTHVAAPHVDAARIRDVVERMNALQPDLVVLLGDYVGGHDPAADRPDSERADILQGVAAFAGLKAPLGVVGVLGNHDWWYDGPAIEEAMASTKVVALANSSIEISRPTGAFSVAGLESLASRRAKPSLAKSLQGVSAGKPLIVIMHEPDSYAQIPGGTALSLAGHSHCGQVNFPITGPLAYPSPGARKWPCGLYQEPLRALYVTGGVGVSILPLRFRAGPEIALLTLRARPGTPELATPRPAD